MKKYLILAEGEEQFLVLYNAHILGKNATVVGGSECCIQSTDVHVPEVDHSALIVGAKDCITVGELN